MNISPAARLASRLKPSSRRITQLVVEEEAAFDEGLDGLDLDHSWYLAWIQGVMTLEYLTTARTFADSIAPCCTTQDHAESIDQLLDQHGPWTLITFRCSLRDVPRLPLARPSRCIPMQ